MYIQLTHNLPSFSIQLGDLHADVKKITDKFFALGSQVANFLDAFVKGQGALPTTTGSIRGLPSAWRRGFGRPDVTRPSLLFMDLPDPSAPDSASRNLAAGSILDIVKGNNRYHIPGKKVSADDTGYVVLFISAHCPLDLHLFCHFSLSIS
jgi:hypothetical protein